MPQKRRTYPSPQKSRQQTLLRFLGSSPPSDDSFSEGLSPGPSKRKRTRKISSSSSSNLGNVKDADSDVGAIRFEPEAVEISDEDHSPRRPKKHKSLTGAHAVPEHATSDGSLEETLVVRRKRKGKNKAVLDSDSDTRSRKRKLIKGVRPPTPEENDDDILDAENQVLESRLRSRGKMTPFQKNLAKLKKLKGRKRGEIALESSSSEVEQSESSAEIPFKDAKPDNGESDPSDNETASHEDEQDFIVDDDEHGVPPAQLPLPFSMSTRQDLTHHFKIVCQLFVHVAVRPLVDRRPFLERALKEEEYFSVPLQVIRRKLNGTRDSLVASSVWRSDFKKALETYPNLTLVRLKFAMPHCDACHLGGRLSTLLGRLTGKPYDEYDFEDVSDDDESDEDGDEEEDAKRAFHLGRFCAARTSVYHQFSHWEYSLYKALQRPIMEAQDKSHRFIKVAYVGGIEPPRDLHDADKVMDWLDQRGIIGTAWQKVRKMMDSARGLERGEVDDV